MLIIYAEHSDMQPMRADTSITIMHSPIHQCKHPQSAFIPPLLQPLKVFGHLHATSIAEHCSRMPHNLSMVYPKYGVSKLSSLPKKLFPSSFEGSLSSS